MVALKERRSLVLVPREMPLSSIHLRRLPEASEAGALVVPAMPAFDGLPQTLEDAVDHVVGKVLRVLGFRDASASEGWTAGRATRSRRRAGGSGAAPGEGP
jgi:4-hydroxy-3-polyprenylbenzoate decarboxylase